VIGRIGSDVDLGYWMLMKRTFILKMGWAIVAVPVLFWIYVIWTYRVAGHHGQLPFQESFAWLWFVVYFLLLASGSWTVARLQLSRPWLRIVLTIIYVVAMALVLLLASLSASCLSGDCL